MKRFSLLLSNLERISIQVCSMHEQFNTSHSITFAIIAPSFLQKDSVPLS